MTEYRALFESRYKKDNMDYAEEMDYLFMFLAPKQYGVEDEMLTFLQNNPNATMTEVYDCFEELVPEGTLPIGFDGSELLEDD